MPGIKAAPPCVLPLRPRAVPAISWFMRPFTVSSSARMAAISAGVALPCNAVCSPRHRGPILPFKSCISAISAAVFGAAAGTAVGAAAGGDTC